MKFTFRIFPIYAFRFMLTFYHKVNCKTVILTQEDILVK